MDILLVIVIGLVAGWLAGLIRKGRGFGWVGNLIIGILGAIVGGILFRIVGLAAYGLIGRIIMATLGALLLLWLLSFVDESRGRRTRR